MTRGINFKIGTQTPFLALSMVIWKLIGSSYHTIQALPLQIQNSSFHWIGEVEAA